MSTAIGSDLQRIGALEKVTGSTRFGADDARPGLAYAWLVTASIGKGRIKSIDTSAAAATAGVLLVLTHETMDRLQSPGFIFGGGYGFQSLALMQSDRVSYRGQAIALVVADSPEAASEAAALVRADYEQEPFDVTLDAPGAETEEAADGEGTRRGRHAGAETLQPGARAGKCFAEGKRRASASQTLPIPSAFLRTASARQTPYVIDDTAGGNAR